MIGIMEVTEQSFQRVLLNDDDNIGKNVKWKYEGIAEDEWSEKYPTLYSIIITTDEMSKAADGILQGECGLSFSSLVTERFRRRAILMIMVPVRKMVVYRCKRASFIREIRIYVE